MRNKTDNTTFADELGRAHFTLRENLDALERAAAKISELTPAGLVGCLEQALQHINEHFRFEEQNGYMSEALREEPRLERRAAALQKQHEDLRQNLTSLVEQTKDAKELDASVGRKIRQWLKTLGTHESAENALIEEAFNTDLSAED